MLETPWSAATNAALLEETAAAQESFDSALAHNLNTAEARAAIFDLVRAANTAADAGLVGAENASAVLDVLAHFDRVFAVLTTDDAAITEAALTWADCEGRLGEAPAGLLAQRALTDVQIEALIEERKQARRNRDFARGDAIRDELLQKGVAIEDSKDGVRWRRK